MWLSVNVRRLFSLARPSDQEHLLMVDTDINPESGSTFFSAITGKRSLTQKWEVIWSRDPFSFLCCTYHYPHCLNFRMGRFRISPTSCTSTHWLVDHTTIWCSILCFLGLLLTMIARWVIVMLCVGIYCTEKDCSVMHHTHVHNYT